MNPLIEFASFAAIIAGLVSSLIYIVILKVKLKNVTSTLLQTSIDANHIKSKLAEALLQVESSKLGETDGFLKFLSDSRDWAFNYVEEVQSSIESLKNAVDNGLETKEELDKLFNLLPENKEK